MDSLDTAHAVRYLFASAAHRRHKHQFEDAFELVLLAVSMTQSALAAQGIQLRELKRLIKTAGQVETKREEMTR